MLADVTKNFDESVLHHDLYHGTHKASSSAKDQQIILDELLNRACVFEEQANRVHTNFTDFFFLKPSLFENQDERIGNMDKGSH